MLKKYKLALHIFRRDLRLEDNTALVEALCNAEQVIPCFIFDPRQIKTNPYQGVHSLQFLQESLVDLAAALQKKEAQLYFFEGQAEEVTERLIVAEKIEAIFINRDYTPFSRQRDAAIATCCKKLAVDFHCYADALLHEPEEIVKSTGAPYTLFRHFFNRAMLLSVNPCRKNALSNYYRQPILLANKNYLKNCILLSHAKLAVRGGRTAGQSLLKKIPSMADYAKTRNFPAENSTTHLSAAHKFGTISIRETYQRIVKYFGKTHILINELYWRDFFTHIAYHFPHVFGNAFQTKYKNLSYISNSALFAAWCAGETGFPLVDAGMRELNQTGFMHNRLRMITASFLCKDLHLDWRLGERYFAQQLACYDPAVNNGNWQWAASTGCDAQPYFRVFNPWRQQEKFDPEAIYIKHWLPELAACSTKEIKMLERSRPLHLKNYPAPLVNHSVESARAKQHYEFKIKIT